MNLYFENVKYQLTLPFRNLTEQARKLQIARFSSSIIVLLFVISSLVGSFASSKAYVVRLDCSHLDVSTGLYNALRTSVSSSSDGSASGSNDYVVDQSLTASQIDILTEYAESQVASAPQYITSGVWNWCYGNYNITQVTKNGKMEILKHHDVLTCSKPSKNYAFDYRAELTQIGLDSILNYAYQANYLDSSYESKVKERHERFKLVPPSLIFCGVTQTLIMMISYILYSNRGSAKDLSGTPRFLSHIQGALSLASFLSVAVGVGIMTGLIIKIRSEISSELSDFGISLHLGSVWFSISWLAVAMSFCCTCSWAGPVWCATPEADLLEDQDDKVRIRNINRFNSFKKVQDKLQLSRDDSVKSGFSFKAANASDPDLLQIGTPKETDDLILHDIEENYNYEGRYKRNHSFMEQTYDGYDQKRYQNNLLSADNDSNDMLNQGTSTRPRSFLTEEEVNFLDKSSYVNIMK